MRTLAHENFPNKKNLDQVLEQLAKGRSSFGRFKSVGRSYYWQSGQKQKGSFLWEKNNRNAPEIYW